MYNYDINYVYVFSYEMKIDDIDVSDCDDHRIVGFKEEQSPFLIGAMANDLKYPYSHKFKCKETLYLKTNEKDSDKNMQIDFKEIMRDCDYISFICGLESDF